MPVVIYTGDERRCRTVNLLECPACGGTFETMEGTFSTSATLGERVLVCRGHGKALTAEEEVKVQDAFQRAIDHPRGHVQKGQKLVKKSELMVQAEKTMARV